MVDKLVSVIIPSYNSEEYLEEAVNSALLQSYPNVEVIVVDDGSTDNTRDLFPKFEGQGIKCFTQENRGASTARNLGLQNASGDYIQYLDSDDVLHKDKIKKQVDLMEHENADLSFCFWGKFTDDISNVEPFQFSHINFAELKDGKDLMRSYGVNNWSGTIHSMLLRKDLANKAGLWNETITNNDDGEYFTRVYVNTKKLVVIEEQLVYHRVGKAETLSRVNSKFKAESALKSWDLIYDLISKENDKTLLAYPKKGYFVNYKMTKPEMPEMAKKFASRFDKIDAEWYLSNWKYYWLVKRFGLYKAAFIFYKLVRLKLIKTDYFPIY